MKTLVVILAFATVTTAQAPTTEITHAAEVVAHIHDTMLDPPSFVLDAVYVTKPNRVGDKEHKGRPTFCYAFRSHNAMGGYSQGAAYEDPVLHGQLTFVSLDGDGDALGYNEGWVAPCKAKNLDRDITADVLAIAPALYKKTR